MADPVEAMLAAIDRHARSCRRELGRDQISPRVMDAMARVPRERFVPAEHQGRAYGDHPLPIGWGQTISQPFVVAFMTDLLDVRAGMRVLEIGTGCGYQAAVLAEMGAEVETLEIVPELARAASALLASLGYESVQVHEGDGRLGLPARAPYDRIIVTAAPKAVPGTLLAQLASGGRLIAPVGGGDHQDILVIDKDEDGALHERRTLPVAFVPLTGVADD